MPGAPDFTDPEISADLRTNSGKYLCITAEGSGAMPGWKETLTNEQMWQVLTYIGSFGN
jgi:mono/diheme cytochrome c family protein